MTVSKRYVMLIVVHFQFLKWVNFNDLTVHTDA